MIFPLDDLPRCQVQVYQDDAGMWWRYCFTCDDGSNERQKHPRGHLTEAQARMSERDHVRARHEVRVGRVLRMNALHDLHTASDLVGYRRAWEAYTGRGFPNPTDDLVRESMRITRQAGEWHDLYHRRACVCSNPEALKW